MKKEYKCDCCEDKIVFAYFGAVYGDKNFSRNFNQNDERDGASLNTLAVFYEPSVKFQNQKGRATNVNIPLEKIPEMIQDLQKFYDKSQEVKSSLVKQGKLESISKSSENPQLFQPDEIKFNNHHKSYESLANLAKEINETAKINKNNKANLSSEECNKNTQFPPREIRETQFTKNSRLNY